MDEVIKQFVYRVRARIREQKIIDQLLKMTGIGLFAAVIFSLVSLMVPFYYAIPMAVGVVVISFALGIIFGIRKTPSPMEAALKADAKGHKERISTAYYLAGKEDAFSTLQKKDALRIVNGFQVRKEFPIKLRWKPVLTVLGLAVIFTISSLMDTPARDMAKTKHEVHKEAEEAIAKLEKVEKQIKENKEISETESKEIKEQLENARKELAEADSYEDLKKAEERITKKMEMASVKTENKTLSEALAKAAEEAKAENADKKAELAEEAKKALEKAANGSAKDKKEAYEKLKKLAEMSGDNALTKAAEEYAASEYSDFDAAKAQDALEELAANLSENNSELAENNNQNNNQNSQNQNSNQKGNTSGNQQTNQKANQNGSENGQGNQPGNNGQGGQNGQNGNGTAGNGNGTGQGGNPGGTGWNRGSKDGQEGAPNTNENITVPDGTAGDDENLTGKQNGNDSSTKTKSNQSKTWSGNKVSYGKVSGKYKDKAYKKVDGSNYPGKLKDKIKNYFDGLN